VYNWDHCYQEFEERTATIRTLTETTEFSLHSRLFPDDRDFP